MADKIPSARMEVEPGAAHFGAMEMLPKVLAQLKEDSLTLPVVSPLARTAAGREPAGAGAAS
jgi:hypothetical protein